MPDQILTSNITIGRPKNPNHPNSMVRLERLWRSYKKKHITQTLTEIKNTAKSFKCFIDHTEHTLKSTSSKRLLSATSYNRVSNYDIFSIPPSPHGNRISHKLNLFRLTFKHSSQITNQSDPPRQPECLSNSQCTVYSYCSHITIPNPTHHHATQHSKTTSWQKNKKTESQRASLP